MEFLPNGTYHCHSTFSDGRSTVDEMVRAAAALGLAEIGLSDHLVLHPSLPNVGWATSLERLDEYAAAVRTAARDHGFRVRLGFEVDFFPENPRQAELEELLARYSPDYMVGGVHYLDEFCVDASAEAWDALGEEQRNAHHRRYWTVVREMAESRQFELAAHLDLTKKFGHRPSADVSALVDAALDAIAAARMAVEINTAGWDKPVGEAYPAPDILERCKARGIPIVLSDDAHHTSELCRHFERARKLLG
jgi:histidinol-phosphatase (PHP family)